MQPFQITSDLGADGVALLRLEGALDMTTAGHLDQELRRFQLDGGLDVVVDLREVTFMDSTGLGAIMESAQRAKLGGGSLRLMQGPHGVQRIFELSGTLEHLNFVDPD